MLDCVVVWALVFGVNLLPAFGPPTWAVLVFLRLNLDVPAVPLVIVGALAAASGRLVLARGARHFRGRLSAERVENLEAAQGALAGSRGKAVAGLGLFALSPVPSAQLFVAAGLLKVPLVPLTAAFFAGEIFTDSLTSPLGIALQLGMLALLVALVRVDWVRIVGRGGARPASP